MKDKKGFTLAELLIVVAIIGVLVAVSIPIFTKQIKKAQIATDNANMRAAKAAAYSAYLIGDHCSQLRTTSATGSSELDGLKYYSYYYDAPAGVAVTDGNSVLTGKQYETLGNIPKYGKIDRIRVNDGSYNTITNKNQIICVAISEDGEHILVGWTYSSAISFNNITWVTTYRGYKADGIYSEGDFKY